MSEPRLKAWAAALDGDGILFVSANASTMTIVRLFHLRTPRNPLGWRIGELPDPFEVPRADS